MITKVSNLFFVLLIAVICSVSCSGDEPNETRNDPDTETPQQDNTETPPTPTPIPPTPTPEPAPQNSGSLFYRTANGADIDLYDENGNGDINCGELPAAAKPVEVITPGNDPYDLDRDGDGWGCDS